VEREPARGHRISLIKALGHLSEIKIEAQDYGNIFIVTPRTEGPAGLQRLRY
jgi:hypothetical protein